MEHCCNFCGSSVLSSEGLELEGTFCSNCGETIFITGRGPSGRAQQPSRQTQRLWKYAPAAQCTAYKPAGRYHAIGRFGPNPFTTSAISSRKRNLFTAFACIALALVAVFSLGCEGQ